MLDGGFDFCQRAHGIQAIAARSESKPRALPHRHPMGRWGDPKEIGGLAVYLASEASSFMTGSVLVLDGGKLLW